MSAPDDTNWLGNSADWSDVAGWSNGIPDSSTISATIAAIDQFALTIGAGESFGIQAATLLAYAGTLLLDGTLSTSAGVTIEGGTLIDAGSLEGPIFLIGGTLLEDFEATTALNLVLEGGEYAFEDRNASSVLVTNASGATFAGFGNIAEAETLGADGYYTAVSAVILWNAGTIAAAGGPLDISVDVVQNSGLLTAGAGDLELLPASLVNEATGTISATGGDLSLGQGFSNAGLITVSGGELSLGGSSNAASWSNTGTISASGALVYIGGDEQIADLSSLELTGDSVILYGTLKDEGGSLGADAGVLAGALLDGTLVGGVLDLAAAGIKIGAAVLDGVTVFNGLTLGTDTYGNPQSLSLENGSAVYADDGVTPGTILVDGGALTILSTAAATIDQPVDLTAGAFNLIGPVTLTGPITASGTGTVLEFLGSGLGTGGTWINASTISAGHGVSVILGGDETASDLGALSLTGANLQFTGILENTGETLNGASGALVGMTLDGGTIIGGGLDAAALGIAFAGGVLDDVALINGLSLSAGAVTLTGGSTVYADSGLTRGTITVNAAPGVVTPPYLEIDTSAGATLGQPIEILSGTVLLSGDLTLTGNIDVDGPGAVLEIDPYPVETLAASGLSYVSVTDSFVNLATISAENGATVLLGGDETAADLGAISRSGGLLEFTGTLENAGQTLAGPSSVLAGATLDGGTIEGGTIDPASLGLVFSGYQGSAFDNVTVINGLTLNSGVLSLRGDTAVFATAAAGSLGTILVGNGEVTFNGAETYTLDNPVVLENGGIGWSGPTGGGPARATIAAGDEISGYGYLTGDSLINSGTIAAAANGGELEIGPLDLRNQGLITASGTELIINPAESWSNAGTIALVGTNAEGGVSGGADLYGTFSNTGLITISHGDLSLGGGGGFENTGLIAATAAVISLAGDETLADLGGFALSQSVLQLQGVIEAAGGTLDGVGESAPLAGATLDNGTIFGGVLDIAAGSLDLASGVLIGVTIIDGLTLTSGPVTLENSPVFADAGVTPGTITVTGSGDSYGILDILVPQAVTLAQAVDVLYGQAAVSGPFTLVSPVTASGPFATFTLTGLNDDTETSWINLSTVGLSDGGLLLLSGIETAADIGSITSQGGTIVFTDGTLENTGLTLGAADPSLKGLELSGGTIEGGAIDVAAISFSVAGRTTGYGPADLDNVAILGSLSVADNLLLTGTSAVYASPSSNAPGSILIDDAALDVATAETYTLENRVTLDDGTLGWGAQAGVTQSSAGIGISILVAPATTIAGDGVIRTPANYTGYTALADTLLNQGVIEALAGAGGGILSIMPSAFTNAGLLTAASGADLLIDPTGAPWTNTGTIAGGVGAGITLGGNFTNNGLITINLGNLVLGAHLSVSAPGPFPATYSTFKNFGTIAANGGLIELDGDESRADLGNFRPGGAEVALTGGTFENAGAVLGSLSTELLGLDLSGGTIEGGTLDPGGLGLTIANVGGVFNATADLDNVTVEGGLRVATDLDISGATTITAAPGGGNSGALSIVTGGFVTFEGAETYTLSNDVTLAGGVLNWAGAGDLYPSIAATVAPAVAIGGFGYLAPASYPPVTLVNQGLITADSAGKSLYLQAASIINAGTFIATNGGVLVQEDGAGTLTGGIYEVQSGSSLEVTDSVLDASLFAAGQVDAFYLTSIAGAGALTLTEGAVLKGVTALTVDGDIALNNGSLYLDTLTVDPTGTLSGAGTVTAGAITSNGLVEASGGELAVNASASGTDTLAVAAFATLDLNGAVSASAELLASGAVLELGEGGSLFTGTIENFAGADQLVIDGLQATSVTFANNVLTISNAVNTLTETLAGSFAGNAFITTLNAAGGSVIELGSLAQALTLAAPSFLSGDPGILTTVSGVELTDTLDTSVTVQVTDQFGVLGATPADGAAVQGVGTDNLVLSGSVAAVNIELASLEYRPPGIGQATDAITLIAAGAAGEASALIEVEINQPPSFALPTAELLQPGTAGPLNFVTLGQPGAAAGDVFTVVLSDSLATMTGTAAAGTSLTGSGGTLVTLSGTLAGINEDFAAVTLQSTANSTLTLSAADPAGLLDTAYLPVDVNLPPAINAPSSFIGLAGVPAGGLGIGIADPYGAAAGETLTVTLQDASGLLAAPGAGVTGAGTPTLTLTGTVDQVDLALDALSYTGAAPGPAGDTLTVSAAIGGAETSATVQILPPAPPSIISAGTFFGIAGAPVDLSGVTLAGPGGIGADELISLTLSDDTGTLTALALNGGSVNSSSSLAITLTGNLSAVQDELEAVSFTAPAALSQDTIFLSATDGQGAMAEGSILAVPVLPSITAPVSFAAADGAGVGGLGISIADPHAEALGETLSVTLADTIGMLSDSGTGITGNGGETLTLTGTADQINADLANLIYTGPAFGWTLDTITITEATPGLAPVTAAAVAIAPTISIALPPLIVSTVYAQVPVSGVTISDPAAANADALVLVTLDSDAGDLSVTAGTLPGSATVTGNYTPMIVLSGSLAAVNAGLATLSYEETGYSGAITVAAEDAFGNTSEGVITTADPTLYDLPNIEAQFIAGADAGDLQQELNAYVISELIPTVFGGGQYDGAAAALGAVDSSFSASMFLAALGQAENILLDTAGGSPPSYGSIYGFFQTLFASTGLSITAAQLGSLATDFETAADDVGGGASGDAGQTQDEPFFETAVTTAGIGGLGSSFFSAFSNFLKILEPITGTAQTGAAVVAAGNIASLQQSELDVVDNQATTPTTANVMYVVTLIGAAVDTGLSAIPLSAIGAAPGAYALSEGGVFLGKLAGIGGAAVAVGQFGFDIYNMKDFATITESFILAELQLGLVILSLSPAAPLVPIIGAALVIYQLYKFFKASGWGDVHLTTYSGDLFNFQAAGEFTLTQSTLPGDSFKVQIRLQPYGTSSSVSVATELGATVGTDRVTFGINRAATVWVDGQASTLSASNPLIALEGGYLFQASANQYAIFWDTGEVLFVTDNGSYLNFGIALAPNDGPNSVRGLLGPNNGAANDFELPDGTVLAQPLSSADLYATFADAWRITQAQSLLDYGSGQTTATFTDESFPSDTVLLSSLPQALVQQAESLAAAAGITNPADAQAAELDYIATGDTSFITSGASASSASASLASVIETATSVASAGVYAVQTSLTEAASAATVVPFTVYLTGTAATETVLDWSVAAPDQTYLGTVAFGGTLPSGVVTIAAGQLLTQFTIDLPAGVLGSLASELLEVTLSSPGGAPLFAPSAEVTITNSQPEPGPVATAGLLDQSGTGLFSSHGDSYVLDLGTLFAGESAPATSLALENLSAAGADLLGGSFGAPIGGGFANLGGSAAGIAAGDNVTIITLAPDTGTLGTNTETVYLFPTDGNATGYLASLPAQELTVTDTIENPALASILSETLVDFGTIHAGDTAMSLVTISNDAAAPAGGLDVAVSQLTGSAIGSGVITTLAAGETNSSGISVGIDTSAPGTLGGNVILAPASDSGAADAVENTAPLPGLTIAVSATVLDYAAASFAEISGGGTFEGSPTTLDLGTIAVGADQVIELGVANVAAGPADLLAGSFAISGSANFTNSGFESFTAVAAGETQSGDFVTLGAGQPGSFSETITLDATDYDGAGYSGALGAQILVIEADVACFAAGTHILTPDGEIAVEHIKSGDEVITARTGSQGSDRVIWVGQRGIDIARHAMPEKVRPVRILAGAFEPGLPKRDLVLSPDHALFIGGHLIEAKTLVNGVTVIADKVIRQVTYHHIELARHDVVLAEGLPAETYLESGNRNMFESNAAPLVLHTDFVTLRREKSFARLASSGPVVRAVRQRLLNRALALGFAITGDVDLVVKAGLERILPDKTEEGELLFVLPARTRDVHLLSSTGVPAEVCADPDDRRVLGVAVAGLALIAGGVRYNIPLDDAAHEGFYGMEAGHRWTAGAARIALPPYSGRAVLEAAITGQAARWLSPAGRHSEVGAEI
jgi:hypothetical protein